MKLSNSILEDHSKWLDFLHNHIQFNDFGTHMHAQDHCARVLLYSLILSDMLNLDELSKEALCMASVFHDSRRLDDGLDKGHGERAAKYYKEYCQNNILRFDPRTYYAIYYHDLNDKIGNEVIGSELKGNALLIYHIFKDADALDRFRLGEKWFDENYLRTEESHKLIEFAKQTVANDLD